METTAVTSLLVQNIASFGVLALGILGACLALSIGLFVFRYGWDWIKRAAGDQSVRIGGFYLRKTPWAGYNRFRSRKWNMAHMPD